jgi:branched-subunit amino acid ABC-type transport system permease component
MNLVPRGDIVAVLITVVCYLGLRSLLRLTSLGVRFRAIAENASLTRTLGMSGRMNFVLAFCVASALVAASAIGSLYLQGIATSDGFVFANFAIAAVIVGGVGSYEGALIGGAILGIAESVSTMWINGAWEGAIGFGVLLLMLLVRPSGILRPAR